MVAPAALSGGRTPLGSAVRTLHPGYFALVMATGIVSIAMHNHRLETLSAVQLWIGCLAYAVLVVLNAWRTIADRDAVLADLRDPQRAFGLFTFVAATDVLGTRFVIAGHRMTAFVLLVVGWAAWVALGYLVPWTALLGQARRPILRDANGTWFIWAVGTQSVAVLAAALEPTVDTGRHALALLAVFCWAIGVFLYAATGMFVAARMLLYPLRPGDLTAPYWVAMGATAITVVAGARIVQMADAPMVAATRGLIAGVAVIFFGFGTWLIPALVAAGIWRHLIRRMPMGYSPALWSVVFPLGMYGVAGYELGVADRLPALIVLGDIEGWIALAAWTLTFVAMIWHWGSVLCARKSAPTADFRAHVSQEPR